MDTKNKLSPICTSKLFRQEIQIKGSTLILSYRANVLINHEISATVSLFNIPSLPLPSPSPLAIHVRYLIRLEGPGALYCELRNSNFVSCRLADTNNIL